MSAQYTNAKEVKSFLTKKIKESGLKITNRLEFDILNSVDEKNQEYLYIHLKDYGCDDFERICHLVKIEIQNNCPNLIEVMILQNNERKQLLWLPKDKNCQSLYECGEEYKSISYHLKSKVKNKKPRF